MTEPGPSSLAHLLTALGADAEAAAALEAELRARTSEPHRRYHTTQHVAEVLAEAHRLLAVEPDADAAAVTLAAWFHDAVYVPGHRPGQSEEASAELAVDLLTPLYLGAGGPLVAEVARLVRLTSGHRVEDGDRSGAVLVDADLWILASPPERYRRYAADVRAEYRQVPDEHWRTGRGEVLRHFLRQLDQLYRSGTDADRAERRRRAAANLTAELAALDREARPDRPGVVGP